MKRGVSLAAAAGLLLATSSSAQAFQAYVAESPVSCDAVTIKSMGTYWPLVDGQMAIFQRDATSPNYTTIVWFLRANGDETGKGRINNGQGVAWMLTASTWTARALKATPDECNGWLPGHGNYNLSLEIQHP